ncbi:MAG: CIA30 family protein [Desulfuromonadales bacterium]|jgi:NADH dehydrogenase [ubiquinone] 1 alpha subcomplex assembly factor 1
MMCPVKETTILNFTEPSPEFSWNAIDDRIMGGESRSQPEYRTGIGLRFSGVVSLANKGGFASIRSATGAFDLSPFSGLIIRVRGDGREYKLSLRTDLFFDGISYQTSFATTKDHWEEIRLPFAAFAPTHHGVRLSTVAPLEKAAVKSFGFFIADRQAGPFQLDIAWIKGAS